MIRTSLPTLIIAALVSITLGSCRKAEIKKEYVSVDSYENLAQIVTLPLDSITYITAYGGCNVVSEGNSPVTECGLCWDTETQPLRLGNHIGTGSGPGITKGKMEGLKPSTKYYLRAYAKNSEGISYGNEITFTTSVGWSFLSSNPGNQQVKELFFANGTLYASTSSNIYTSGNLAKSWNNMLSSYNSACFAAKNNSVFAGTNSQLYITTDNGNTWNSQYVGYTINDLLITSAMYIISGSDIHRSFDGGQNWTLQNNGLNGFPIVLAAKGNDLYVGTTLGICKSTNNGVNWTSVMTGQGVQSIEVSGTNLLAGTTQGVFISQDNGVTWANTGILSNSSSEVYCTGSNAIAWSYASNFVYTSANSGLTWKKSVYTDSQTPSTITSNGSNYYAASTSGILTLPVNSN